MRTGEISTDILADGDHLSSQEKQDDIIAALGAVLGNYKINDVDADTSPNYYGFTDKDGNWFILKETLSAGADTYRYVKGSSNYTTNWTARVGLSYDYYYNVF